MKKMIYLSGSWFMCFFPHPRSRCSANIPFFSSTRCNTNESLEYPSPIQTRHIRNARLPSIYQQHCSLKSPTVLKRLQATCSCVLQSTGFPQSRSYQTFDTSLMLHKLSATLAPYSKQRVSSGPKLRSV